MPLLDHFHKPWDDEAPWESIGAAWIGNVLRELNKTLPSFGYRAYMQVHLGHQVEADIAEFKTIGGDGKDDLESGGGLQTAVVPKPTLTFEPTFPDEFEVRIKEIKGEKRLVAVIEFVSPSNKDREESRSHFLMKCHGYLQIGIGLVIVDTITNRHFNLHNELLAQLGRGRVKPMPDTPTYVASYRPSGYSVVETIDVWPYPLVVGQPIPSVPLPLKNGPDIMIDLETTYTQSLADHNF